MVRRPFHAPNAEAARRANPGYADGLGASYEKKCLPTALAGLSEATHLNEPQRKAAEGALRQFIRDRLTALVDDAFLLLPEHQKRCISELDEQMRGVLSLAQFNSWRTWRRESNHALRFLMQDVRDPRVLPTFTLQRFE